MRIFAAGRGPLRASSVFADEHRQQAVFFQVSGGILREPASIAFGNRTRENSPCQCEAEWGARYLTVRKSTRMKRHSTLAPEAFSLAFSRATSEVSVQTSLKAVLFNPYRIIPGSAGDIQGFASQNRCSGFDQMKSCWPMSQGVCPDLYFSLERSSIAIRLPLITIRGPIGRMRKKGGVDANLRPYQ